MTYDEVWDGFLAAIARAVLQRTRLDWHHAVEGCSVCRMSAQAEGMGVF